MTVPYEQAAAAAAADIAARMTITDGIPVPPGITDKGDAAIRAYVSNRQHEARLAARDDDPPPAA
jgi:hypothetical protein